MRKTNDNMLALQQRFTKEIMEQSLIIPALLLKAYQQLGINDAELVALLKLMSVKRQCGIKLADFAELLDYGQGEAAELADKLQVANLLGINQLGEVDFEPLYNTLFDFWLFGQMAGGAEAAADKPKAKPRSKANKLLRSFEKDLGRPLSPVEIEKIMSWAAVDKFPDDMIIEALHIAVLQGKGNFAYMDAILSNWRGDGLVSLTDIKARGKQPAVSPKTGRARSKKASFEAEYDSSYEQLVK